MDQFSNVEEYVKIMQIDIVCDVSKMSIKTSPNPWMR